MAYETLYLLREVAKRTAQDEIRIPIESLREIVIRLRDEDNVVIYSVARLDEELGALQKLSFLAIEGDAVVIRRDAFLDATRFVERQEELFRHDRYAATILEKIKQKAQQLRPP